MYGVFYKFKRRGLSVFSLSGYTSSTKATSIKLVLAFKVAIVYGKARSLSAPLKL